MKRWERVERLQDRILEEARINKSVTTWHWNDFFDDCAEIMGWPDNEIQKNATRLRYHLNKMVDMGLLEKGTIGTGWCGKSDFGHTWSNCYTITPLGLQHINSQ